MIFLYLLSRRYLLAMFTQNNIETMTKEEKNIKGNKYENVMQFVSIGKI